MLGPRAGAAAGRNLGAAASQTPSPDGQGRDPTAEAGQGAPTCPRAHSVATTGPAPTDMSPATVGPAAHGLCQGGPRVGEGVRGPDVGHVALPRDAMRRGLRRRRERGSLGNVHVLVDVARRTQRVHQRSGAPSGEGGGGRDPLPLNGSPNDSHKHSPCAFRNLNIVGLCCVPTGSVKEHTRPPARPVGGQPPAVTDQRLSGNRHPPAVTGRLLSPNHQPPPVGRRLSLFLAPKNSDSLNLSLFSDLLSVPLDTLLFRWTHRTG